MAQSLAVITLIIASFTAHDKFCMARLGAGEGEKNNHRLMSWLFGGHFDLTPCKRYVETMKLMLCSLEDMSCDVRCGFVLDEAIKAFGLHFETAKPTRLSNHNLQYFLLFSFLILQTRRRLLFCVFSRRNMKIIFEFV